MSVLTRLALVSALAMGVGCGDDDGDSTDSTMTDMGDTTGDMTVDPGGYPGTVPDGLPTASLGEGVSGNMAESTSPANFECLGTRTAPEGGADSTFTLEVREFVNSAAVEGLCVKFFPDNMVDLSADCDPGTDLVTDAMGNVQVTAPEGGWYAYRIFPNAGLEYADAIQVNEAAPAEGGTATANSVSNSTLTLVPGVLGVMAAPATSLVAGTVVDCDGEPVYGAVLAVYDEAGNYIAEGGPSNAPKYRFFDGDSFPSPSQRYTHIDGLFGGVNMTVAAGGENFIVEAWVDRGEGLEVFGCEQVPAAPDAISIVNIGPLRADGPACPGLN